MKFKVLIALDYNELLALTEEDVMRWVEQKLDGKVAGLSVLEATTRNSHDGTMNMRFLFEVTATRMISYEVMKGWLAVSPSYFDVSRVEYVNS